MSRVAIVFHSATGTTEKLARSIAAGVRSRAGSEAVAIKIDEEHIARGRYRNETAMRQLDSCAGIIFGSPTYMGSVSAQFKAFMDATSERWGERTWEGKLAAGFTIGSSPSGDQLNTLQTLQVFANQHGMLWLGLDLVAGGDSQGRNRLGAHSGLVAQADGSDVHPADLLCAEYLGGRLTDYAKLLCNETRDEILTTD